ncbi:acyl-CoA dehydrogenase family protein [Arenimonas caeni]|jgi:acyl-CoA dehydrogenase|uniref:acyl-CoA dehydrogenase family protein n=1 Tax=Arenimonas caeni TaxID=2058085 RepID=UPI002A35C3CF|nr:acyl-CoA dehydrogenase family protein [Arenimonas caeni]MDY0022710.1 acyl-CoA dehydrogenase family protein [Arenimonas caeni]
MSHDGSLFPFSPRSRELQARVAAFVRERIVPAEPGFAAHAADPATRWSIPPVLEALKAEAKAQGLWNLFLPESAGGLSNLDYAPVAEAMGRSLVAPEVFNCNAPDTGNMEVLMHFATPHQQAPWLPRLLAGEIRSGFAMTEPDVASSDATNIAMPIVREGDEYVINGRKWWTTGAADPRCAILIVMGVTEPDAPAHQRQSMVLVPMDTPGVRIVRPLTVFGYDDAPSGHVELAFENVRVPVSNRLGEPGSGFAIAQARLGPGRIHHCMRLIGLAQRALEAMVERARTRVAFGRPLGGHGMAQEAIARSRCEIEQARLLTLQAAAALDARGNKGAKDLIGMIKIVAPSMACRVIDRAIQLHGGGGLSQDHFLAQAYAGARSLRLADGPDEVHLAALARSMLKA